MASFLRLTSSRASQHELRSGCNLPVSASKLSCEDRTCIQDSLSTQGFPGPTERSPQPAGMKVRSIPSSFWSHRTLQECSSKASGPRFASCKIAILEGFWELAKSSCQECDQLDMVQFCVATNECHSFAVKHAWDYKRDRRADCSWARLVNPEVKASDVFLFGLHPKIKPETFLVGSEAYKLEVKASHMLLRGLHPT